MSRIHNFSAGPGVLPETVLLQAQDDLWDHMDSGMGILECSHRSKQFDDVIESAKARLGRLLHLDDDQEVLFLHGGARTQFFMFPMNFLRGARATYLDTGTWADGALVEAQRFGTVDVPFSSRTSVPEPGSWGTLPEHTRYLHYTSNNTVAGTEYHYVPDSGSAWLVCDMSSDFLSRPIDGSKFDFIYAGAQKNVGPSGATAVILRRSLLEHCDLDLPKMLQYGIHVDKGSMYNTPCTFSIYIIEKVTAWLEDNGGLEAMERRNVAQSDKLYGLIDSSDFWEGKVEVASRSRMNPTFTTGNADLDTTFWQNAAEAGLSGLKGHRSVGGLRASMYNAQTDEAVDALIAYMESFEQVHGTTASPLGENGSGHVDGFDDSEDIDEVVIIIDEDDNEHECAILMVIEQHGIEYAVLAPTDQLVDDDGTEIELFILTITTDENGEETFGFIEEESEYEMVKAVVSTLMESN